MGTDQQARENENDFYSNLKRVFRDPDVAKPHHPAADPAETRRFKAQRPERPNPVLRLLESTADELSPQEIHAQLRSQGGRLGLATIYRQLRQLSQLGQVRHRMLSNGERVYSPVERDQHHLTCVNCGSSEPLPICPVDTRAQELSKVLLHGFRPLFHTFEIHGLCVRCQRPGAASRG
ncbi:MAG: transcriptional repressor [Synechococcus sp. SB0676_bin_10]|uniref:Transcriptional repressor n=1 Tax=Synechococcus sp. SB0676_bin_10 TaxID=2604869 RepID=A0A6B1F3Q7_9SYNE|nr:transcriptional repressor [Synechococcus sp. SB0676_bin_10]MYK07240.1 transcriptional repressor [Synechococcus sp. SB0670_bin_20]